ncbi:YIF1-domain-containing protein [Schizophyllum commune]
MTSSPPPLRHPVPTHPAYIPEPPSTPASPPAGYQRYSSSPQPGPTGQPAHAQQYVPAYPFQNPAAPGPQNLAQQPQPSHFGGPIPGWNMNNMGVDSATAQLGMQLGSSAVAAGQEYVQKNLQFFPKAAVKHHFNVSNSYVIHKLKLVLFPWTHKPWARRKAVNASHTYSQPQPYASGAGYPQSQYYPPHAAATSPTQGPPPGDNALEEFLPPRDDINSPDLYIPSMAMVTYILVSAIQRGLGGGFDPKVLGETFSVSILIVFVDICFVKTGTFLLAVPPSAQVSLVDLVAYSGYKFVGVTATVLTSFLHLGKMLYTLVFFYTFLANAFFLLRALRPLLLPPTHSSPSTGRDSDSRRRRIAFLFVEACVQIVWMWLLVR